MLKVERCMQFRLMLPLIISEHPTSTIKDRTPFGSTPGGISFCAVLAIQAFRIRLASRINIDQWYTGIL
jgi:hypothetical protein